VVKKFIDGENAAKKTVVDQQQVHELFGISSKKEAEKSPKVEEAAFDLNKYNPFEAKNEVKLVNEEHIKPELRQSLVLDEIVRLNLSFMQVFDRRTSFKTLANSSS